jgi:Asp-tRNA(Asn)/Glu-tRNA(Gln) amidotransferase C subunit
MRKGKRGTAVLDIERATRKDEAAPISSSSAEDLLRLTPAVKDGYIQVKQVL